MPVWIGYYRLGFKHLVAAGAVLLLVVGLIRIFSYTDNYLQERTISALSWIMSGKVIVVDAGHGGKDSGARNQVVWEKDITLEIAEKLANLFRASGAKVVMTRDGDFRLGTRQRQDLILRGELANEHDADAVISIHTNSFPADRSQQGAQTFTQVGEEQSKKLSEAIQAEIVRLLGNTDRTPRQSDYRLARTADMPVVLVEVGFLSNPKEVKLLQDPGYQEKMAYAIYSGVVKYFAELAMPTTEWVDEKIIETFRQNEGQTIETP
ncbi:MAG: N-acetylmuramoyl-L-alanine amidase [Clostridia bacterium]|jgi:N-acetylmuramoyl-L-alanine amidase|nr:N-acetylmuramoyl-L-alanine amidase [Clostridia bacterium]MDQ7792088.1 N-acetylmuramoyl-L-alanine amidase [Clostridia bacterium]